jgi:hypothetical protein
MATPQPLDDLQAPQGYPNGVGINNTYRFESGVCILPVAEEPPTDIGRLASYSPVVALQLHAPYRVRRVRYDTRKVNNPPVVPTPQSIGAFVFVGGVMGVVTSLNSSLGTFDWDVVNDYTFVESCVSRPQDGLVLGLPPWTWVTSQENSLFFAGALEVGAALSGAGQIGAIARAGPDAKVGYVMGQQAAVYLSKNEGWGYNTPSFFPGGLFNGDLVNAGPAPAGSASLSSGG